MADRTTERPPGGGGRTDEAPSSVWALGDYHRFATTLIWDVGPELVSACGIGPRQRVLDVAAGTGNVALRAAEAGARVTASDLTPESLDAGRREAEARGLAIDWVQADAAALPFADAAFDVVTSSFGAIFAPDQEAVGRELVRVCRPGGTIGMVNFTPDGLAAEFFEVVGRHAPPPPAGTPSPMRWGDEGGVRALLGDTVEIVELHHGALVERLDGSPADYCAFYRATFGPVVAIYDLLAGDPDAVADLDRDFLDFATRANRGSPGGPVEYRYETLRVVARRL